MCKTDSTMQSSNIDIEAPAVETSADSNGNDTSKPTGFHLRWSRLVKTVQIKESTAGLMRGSIASTSRSQSFRATSGTSVKAAAAAAKGQPIMKTILDEVSGAAKPGEVLAMMGPSGSGKTSLLNTLSGRSSYESGVISVNGEALTAMARKKLMSKIAYVKQQDVFFEHLTVRDQLAYTALLRLPSSRSHDSKLEEVEKIISLLRLTKVADSPIRMVSGGEKKRVNIGTELLTDPRVLLLDEPTSGLDSTSAVALIGLLQKLARAENKTIITSIHQPSSSVFRSFDKLLMLAEGSVVYFGTPSASLSYLRDLNLTTPEGYNAADHWMDLLVRDNLVEGEDEEGEDHRNDQQPAEKTGRDTIGTSTRSAASHMSSTTGMRRRKSTLADQNKPRGILLDAWDNEALAEEMEVQEKEASETGTPDHLLDDATKYNTTWLTQYFVLTHRSMKNGRSAIFTTLNFIKSAVLGLVVGLLWFQLKWTEKSLKDISSLFFFTMTYWVFDSMFNALLSFPTERTVILKERASSSYRLSAYFMAKTTSEAPMRLILPFVYIIISFWMSGVNNHFSVFVGTSGCVLLSVLAGEALGLMVGAAVYDVQNALTTMTVMALTLMLLGGFYIDNVPAFVSWARFLSPFKYAFDASQQLVFNKNIPCDGSGTLQEICKGLATGYATPEQVLKFQGAEGTIASNVGLLLLLCTVPRYIAYLALRAKKSGDRD